MELFQRLQLSKLSRAGQVEIVQPKKLRLAVVVLVWIAYPAFLTPSVRAQDAAAEQTKVFCPLETSRQAPFALGRQVLGPGRCYACHFGGTTGASQLPPVEIAAIGADYFRGMKHDKWVLGNEWATWAASDRHVQAYSTLLMERAQQMSKILGVDRIDRDPRCLACHSSFPVAAMPLKNGLLAKEFFAGRRVDERLALGVNCEACHGASGDNNEQALEGWYGPHVSSATWRNRSAEDKQRFGFYDVRSPASRTRMCLSCHLGSAEDGRFVTHEMYAAGHPPLPGFEVETFLRTMPPHWRRLGSTAVNADDGGNSPMIKATSLTQSFLDQTEDAFFTSLREDQPDLFALIRRDYTVYLERTRSLAVGAVVAWSENVKLTAALAARHDYPLLPERHRWPDYAQFECYACHHELEIGGYRQQRSAKSAPGALPLKAWPSPLMWVVCQAAGEEAVANLQDFEDFINAATALQPFGDRTSIVNELTAAGVWADDLADTLESHVFLEVDGRRLLKAICDVGSENTWDYDSSRQLMWAFQEILNEVDRTNDWSECRNKLHAMQASFVLDLATKDVRAENVVDIPGFGQTRALEIDLTKVLPAINKFPAFTVREQFFELAKTLRQR